jgi:hypothetical protein
MLSIPSIGAPLPAPLSALRVVHRQGRVATGAGVLALAAPGAAQTW